MTATLCLKSRVLALGASLAISGCAGAFGYEPGDTDSGDGTTGGNVSSAGSAGATTGGPPPPEEEDEGDFRVPKASGKYVYSASEEIDAVAVIDTATLAIDVVGVGQDPTVVLPLPGVGEGEGAVAVLDQGSNDVVVLRTATDGHTTVELFPVTPGANNLAATPDGGFVFVYHDIDGPEQLGPGSDQELTVIDLAGGGTYEMTVGAHPREIVFAGDGGAAYVITAAGVNVIELAGLGAIGKPPLIPVVPDPAVDPATVEVHVVAAQAIALSRVDGHSWIAVTDLSDGTLEQIELGGVLTDLDLASDDSFAVAVLPDVAGSRFAEIALPPGGPPEVVLHDVGGEYVGLTDLSADGAAMVLYTTQNPWAGAQQPVFASTTGDTGGGEPPSGDPRRRVTLARRSGSGWQLDTIFVEVPVETVGLAPDSANAIIVHRLALEQPDTPGSYSLLDITQPFPLAKRQTTAAAPGAVLFTPDGARAALLLRDDAKGVAQVDLVDLATFIVETLDLGSPPEGLGWVEPTEKIFVSQAHPTGRITFIDPAGMVQTITGFVLNDSVKD